MCVYMCVSHGGVGGHTSNMSKLPSDARATNTDTDDDGQNERSPGHAGVGIRRDGIYDAHRRIGGVEEYARARAQNLVVMKK